VAYQNSRYKFQAPNSKNKDQRTETREQRTENRKQKIFVHSWLLKFQIQIPSTKFQIPKIKLKTENRDREQRTENKE
jgi:hypothetical protein